MGDHADGDLSFLPQVFQQIHDPYLVGQIQRRRRFVQKKQARLLADGPGNDDPLPFPAGELLQGPAGQMDGVGGLHGLAGDGIIFFLLHGQQPEMGGAAHEHRIRHLERKVRFQPLGHQGGEAGRRE